MKVGDMVAIRGDLRKRNDGTCQYTDDQLIDGKYIKHANSDKMWVGRVDKVNEEQKLALVAGGWRGFEHYEVVKQ